MGTCFQAHPLQAPQQAAYRHLPAGRPADSEPREVAEQPAPASTYVHPADACLPAEARSSWQQQEAFFSASLPREPVKVKAARNDADLEPPPVAGGLVEFWASETFRGKWEGMVFQRGPLGQGYYPDRAAAGGRQRPRLQHARRRGE